jgi:hypothetical protein
VLKTIPDFVGVPVGSNPAVARDLNSGVGRPAADEGLTAE